MKTPANNVLNFFTSYVVYFSEELQQQGLNKNINGLLSHYFPKDRAIALLSKQEIEQAKLAINIRPRKALNYLSSYEYTDKAVSLILAI